MNVSGMLSAFVDDATEVVVDLVPVDPGLVVEGAPRTGYRQWGSWAGMEVGVWEMSPGSMRDVEVEEIFLVVAGQATLHREVDGLPRIDHLRPGVVGVLREGEETQWHVTEALRKVYLTPIARSAVADSPPGG